MNQPENSKFAGKSAADSYFRLRLQFFSGLAFLKRRPVLMQKVCFVCLQPSRLKCSRCDAIQYCGKECQKKDWKVHKHNCQDKNIYCDGSDDDTAIYSGSDDNSAIFVKAQNYLKTGNCHRAEKCYRKLLEPSIRLQHPHAFLVGCLTNLSIALHNQGKHDEASEIAQESLVFGRSKLGANHPQTLDAMDILAKSYTNLKKFNQAYELLNECIEKSTKTNGKDHCTTIRYMTTFGNAYSQDGRHNEAQKILRECLAMIKNDDKRNVEIMITLSSSYIVTRHNDEAEKLLLEY